MCYIGMALSHTLTIFFYVLYLHGIELIRESLAVFYAIVLA